MVARGQEREKWEMTANGDGGYFGGDANILELDSSDGCTGF